MSDRSKITYVTQAADPPEWLNIDLPHGLIAPPTIELHEPLAGPVTFYYAQCYGLPIPAEAQ